LGVCSNYYIISKLLSPRSAQVLRARGGRSRRADTVGYPDARIGIASDKQAGMLRELVLDCRHACFMSEHVLRHRGGPAVDADELGFRGEFENLSEFLPDQTHDFGVAEAEDFRISCPAQEATQQGVPLGGALEEFLVHERASHQSPRFGPWRKEPESGWELARYRGIVPEGYGQARAVRYLRERGRKPRVHRG